MKKIVWLLLCGLIIAPVWLPGSTLPERLKAPRADAGSCEASNEELRQAMAEVHDKQQNVGLSVAIRRGGKAVYSSRMGMADLEHRAPVGPDTRFGIASITKLFTAIALLKLRSAGKIDLDAPVQKYVPEYPKKPEGEITVRMLATHRSGIPHPQNRTPKLFATHYASALDAMEVYRDEPLASKPDSKYLYSSSNYNLIAAAIEKVTGKRFTEVVEREILKPLGLKDTSFDNVLRTVPNRSRRYSYYHPWTYAESDELFVVPIWDYSFNAGGGGLISTAGDVARFGESLMGPGFLTAEEMEIFLSDDWFGRKDDKGRRLIYATGANPGVQAALAVYPDLKTSASVLSNTWGKGSRSGEMVDLAKRLAALCVGK